MDPVHVLPDLGSSCKRRPPAESASPRKESLIDKRLKLNSDITAGPQPSEQDLQELALEGYKSVVNLRFAGEQAEQPTPTAEGELVHRLGMHYEHLPVAMREMEAEKVD